MTWPVCYDSGGWAAEGKETRHSFEELGYLEQSQWKKNKAENSSTVESYNSSTVRCFMLILGHTKSTWTFGSGTYLSLLWADQGAVQHFSHLKCIKP